MFLALVALFSTPAFCPPQPWAGGIASPPRLPFVADVDGDGFADIVVVFPEGDGIIDVSLSRDGQKCGHPFQALSKWHSGIQSAVTGEFDGTPGADVAGVFGGETIDLAAGFKGGKFQDVPGWAKLPEKLPDPILLAEPKGRLIVAGSKEGVAYAIDVKTKKIEKLPFPRKVVWAQSEEPRWAMRADGQIGHWTEKGSFVPVKGFKEKNKGSRPAVWGDEISFDGIVVRGGKAIALPEGKLPIVQDVRQFGDVDHDGDADLVVFRNGTEQFWANSVLLYRAVSPGETDWDHDGLTNEEEVALGTDPMNPDTDNDGLLDGWEVKGFRGLDLKALGCDPRHMDVICYVSPFDGTEDGPLKGDLVRAASFYRNLKISNPDGTKGLYFHPIYLPMLKKPETDRPWWENRDRILPPNMRGVAHWMEITPNGGGQADQLGDGGGCGGWKGAAYATFIHEFGHQMGLDHTGYWAAGWCPTYPSLMNYAYSYGLEDDGNKIKYSDGDLKSYVIHEQDLDETLPLPYDKVKFLEKGPYRYHLKPNGNTTLIDWNWNGVFGEKHVRADINYGYSTSAGRRDEAGRGDSAPWLLVHKKIAYLVFAQRPTPGDGKADNSVSPDRPGALIIRRLVKPFEWKPAVTVEKDGVTGDPVGISYGGSIWLIYQTAGGLKLTRVDADGKVIDSRMVDKDSTRTPSVGEYKGRVWLFLWDPKTGTVTYRRAGRNGDFDSVSYLGQRSAGPVGMTVDTIHGEVVLGMSQDQGDKKPGRWQIRRYKVDSWELQEMNMEWIEGEAGAARGYGRCVVLFDASKDAGSEGRVYYFARGGDAKTDATCNYVGLQIADKSVHGGWLIKRYYDEWSNSRSACAAAWFAGDIIYCYRWRDGNPPRDGIMHVGYAGTGIETVPMADFDDVGFIRDYGIRHSILYLGGK